MTGPGYAVAEIYPAIFGESWWAGLPGVILRLAGCNLRCAYCDTRSAWQARRRLSLPLVLARVKRAGMKRVLVTGGEPLARDRAVELLRALCRQGHEVMLETNGSVSIRSVPQAVHVVLDIKTPGSGEVGSFAIDNLQRLKRADEVKFVLCDRRDYLFARKTISRAQPPLPNVILSPAFGRLDPRLLSAWMLKDKSDARLGLQLHKYIHGPDATRV